MAKIPFAPANFAEASAEPSATLALDWRSSLHTSHSERRIASGAAFSLSSFWHAAWLHSLCPFQLPGTTVAKPCKNAWFVSDNAPFRTSCCKLCNQISWVRSHSCHGFRPGPCPRSTLARGWYGLLSSFCPASTIATGHLPKKFHVAVAAATYHLQE